ncbi:UDP binding domain-containing protein [Streptomyces sp. NPDC090077]|uniref:UDP binding domain-containing protein n=1 Tax=Streptomyces sp. NPDC090077 TaxID=3365938 RepID=UPI003820AC23
MAPNISDSPALDVALRMHRAGADVRVHDPSVNDLVRRHYPELTVVNAPAEALTGAGVLIVATDWPRYTALDPASLADSTTRTVIDARRCLDPARWQAAGWDHQQLGVSPPPHGPKGLKTWTCSRTPPYTTAYPAPEAGSSPPYEAVESAAGGGLGQPERGRGPRGGRVLLGIAGRGVQPLRENP